ARRNVVLSTFSPWAAPTGPGLLPRGRQLEVRRPWAFVKKIPRLNDRYFQSRPTSDMAARSHSIHQVRLLPDLGGQLVLLLCELALMTAGIAWLDPRSAPVAGLAALGAAGLPLAGPPRGGGGAADSPIPHAPQSHSAPPRTAWRPRRGRGAGRWPGRPAPANRGRTVCKPAAGGGECTRCRAHHSHGYRPDYRGGEPRRHCG